jgi:serine/threonine-protein kinase RsbT
MPVGAQHLPLAGELDVADAARAARELARACGLSGVEAQHVATAVSEVATNACKYAGGGEVELAPAEPGGRAGVLVAVRDSGPGISDVAAALRDGVSSGGSLGLGLPGARRLMDAFAIDTAPGRGTVVRMARWAGGAAAAEPPVGCRLLPGAGGEAMVQPYRNGVLLALAAGPRAADLVRLWRTRPWHAPARLAEAGRGDLHAGERLGVVLAGFSELDGRLDWLAAGAVAAALVRDGHVAARPPGGRALARAGGVLRGATAAVQRDDALVLAAAPLEDAALLALAGGAPGSPGPAALVARFSRGALEPRRRALRDAPHRRETDR